MCNFYSGEPAAVVHGVRTPTAGCALPVSPRTPRTPRSAAAKCPRPCSDPHGASQPCRGAAFLSISVPGHLPCAGRLPGSLGTAVPLPVRGLPSWPLPATCPAFCAKFLPLPQHWGLGHTTGPPRGVGVTQAIRPLPGAEPRQRLVPPGFPDPAPRGREGLRSCRLEPAEAVRLSGALAAHPTG